MTTDVIASDSPLTASQRQTLSALLDTLIPASGDGTMPSAAELDLTGYLRDSAGEFLPLLTAIVDEFDEGFAALPMTERCPLVEAFAQAQPELFQGLIFQVYACYYSDDRSLQGIGMAAGPPFPRGNTVEEGDLSLLDPVVRKSRTYRR